MTFCLEEVKSINKVSSSCVKRIINNEEIPESFKKTTLFMLWKRKYPMNILKNNRFIHLKDILPHTVEVMTVNKMKDTIINDATMYQVGGLPGHSVDEHLFTLKSVIVMREAMDEGIILPSSAQAPA